MDLLDNSCMQELNDNESTERLNETESTERFNDVEPTEKSIETEPTEINPKTQYKLYRAAKEGNLATFRSLLEGIKDEKSLHMLLSTPIIENEEIVTPLLIAAAGDRFNIVEVLLSDRYSMSVQQTGTVYLNGHILYDVTPLHCAAGNCNLQMVTLMVEHGADINHRAQYNHTPVTEACINGDLNIVRYLVQHGADINVSHTFNQEVCLTCAVRKKDYEITKFLLAEGADPNAQLQNGKTSLHLAAKVDSVALVTLLLNSGAIFELKDNNGFTALDVACKQRCEAVIQCFLRELKLPVEEEIRAWELLGASMVFDNHCIMGFYWIGRALGLRIRSEEEEDGKNIEKIGMINVNMDPVVYGRRPESTTEEELNDIDKENNNETKREALLIMERILGENNVLCPKRVISHLLTEAGNFQDMRQYPKCISLYIKTMNIKLNTNKSIARHIERFVTLFAEMVQNGCELDANLLVNILDHCLTDLEQEWLKINYLDYKPAVSKSECNVSVNVKNTLLLIAMLKHLVPDDEEEEYPTNTITMLLSRYVSRLLSLEIRTGERLQQSILHIACSSNFSGKNGVHPTLLMPNYNVIKLLIVHDADINAVDNEGNSPLHILASYNGHEDNTVYNIMILLLESGVHIDPLNKEGARPLDVANPVVVDKLKEATRKVPLKCLAAQTIKLYYCDGYKNHLPSSLVKFVEMHG